MNLANSDFKFRKANQDDHLKLKFRMKSLFGEAAKECNFAKVFSKNFYTVNKAEATSVEDS